ncbi:hypothetical protein AGMMS49944_23430 [Spirochaetia bacterium]|nr:hypothetical protein AGMMS49944_23430 [Spirochaetia bacterium]
MTIEKMHFAQGIGVIDKIVLDIASTVKIKHPRPKGRGIEDFSLKSLRTWGNISPTPPALRPKGRGIIPLEIKNVEDLKILNWVE